MCLWHKTPSEVINMFEEHLCQRCITFCKTEDETRKIALNLYIKHGIPCGIGCVDGTHVRIVAPSNNKHLYYNRKGYYILNVMLVNQFCQKYFNPNFKTIKNFCDHELRIQYVDAFQPGACHDCFISNTSELRALLEQKYLRKGSNYWLLDIRNMDLLK